MYLLIFEAWATMLGFTLNTNMLWNGVELEGSISSWAQLANQDPNQLASGTKNALLLANIMSHTSMIVIFAIIIMFMLSIFNLVKKSFSLKG